MRQKNALSEVLWHASNDIYLKQMAASLFPQEAYAA